MLTGWMGDGVDTPYTVTTTRAPAVLKRLSAYFLIFFPVGCTLVDLIPSSEMKILLESCRTIWSKRKVDICNSKRVEKQS